MVTILVDDRELRSGIPAILERLGARVKVERLEIADYVAGSTGVERKYAHDFLSSIVDKRLFEQAKYLSSAYERAVVIVEGDLERAISNRKIGFPQAYGALVSLLDLGVHVFTVRNHRETAWLIFSLARREEKRRGKRYLAPVKVRVVKYNKGVLNIQLNLVSSIPGISIETAHKILMHFGTPRRFFKASSAELRKVQGLGEKRIKKIIEVLDTDYRALSKLEGQSGIDEDINYR